MLVAKKGKKRKREREKEKKRKKVVRENILLPTTLVVLGSRSRTEVLDSEGKLLI